MQSDFYSRIAFLIKPKVEEHNQNLQLLFERKIEEVHGLIEEKVKEGELSLSLPSYGNEVIDYLKKEGFNVTSFFNRHEGRRMIIDLTKPPNPLCF